MSTSSPLLRFLGCTSDAAETAAMVGGDERAYNAAMAPVISVCEAKHL